MELHELSRDTFNELAHKLSMKDLWKLCSSSPQLKLKCNYSDFWINQLNFRYPRLVISQNPRQQFLDISIYIEQIGIPGNTWFIQVSNNPSYNLQPDISPCDSDIKIDIMIPTTADDYTEPDSYSGNVNIYIDMEENLEAINRWIYVLEDEYFDIIGTVGFAKSESPVIPGQRVWVAVAFNEDYMSHVAIWDSVGAAQDYLISIVELYYNIERPKLKHDMLVYPLDEMLAFSYQQLNNDKYIQFIRNNNCWYYPSDKYPARTFRIVEHVMKF